MRSMSTEAMIIMMLNYAAKLYLMRGTKNILRFYCNGQAASQGQMLPVTQSHLGSCRHHFLKSLSKIPPLHVPVCETDILSVMFCSC